MVLVVKALSHANKAKAICDSVRGTNGASDEGKAKLVAAAKEFRLAAGILSTVRATLLPQWKIKPNDEDLPTELSFSCLSNLEAKFLINAQSITIAVSYFKIDFSSEQRFQATNKGLRVVIQLLKGMSDKLESMSSKQNIHLLDDEAVMFHVLMDAVVCKLLANLTHSNITDALESDKESAKSVELIRTANNAMQEVVKVYKSLKTNKDTFLEELRHFLNAFNEDVKATLREYSETNDKVYFGAIEGFDVTKELAQYTGAFLPKPIDFSLPSVTSVSFSKKVQPPPELPKAPQDPPPPYPTDTRTPPSNNDNNNIDFARAGIDPEVFNALPEHLQKEVLEQYRRTSRGTTL